MWPGGSAESPVSDIAMDSDKCKSRLREGCERWAVLCLSWTTADPPPALTCFGHASHSVRSRSLAAGLAGARLGVAVSTCQMTAGLFAGVSIAEAEMKRLEGL